MGGERQLAGQPTAAAIMVSGGGGGGSREAGKKRKASPEAVAAAAMRREPRRGLGVAELERIRVALEVAERCYAAQPLPAPAPAPAMPPAALVVHGASLATVGNGALQLQLPRGYFTPHYVAAQQYESLTRLFASSGHPSSLQNGRQADQIQSAVTALPAAGQAASSESSSSAYQQQLQSHRRRAQPRLQQPDRTAVPAAQVPFVDLVDSDDEDNGGEVEELDLELKL